MHSNTSIVILVTAAVFAGVVSATAAAQVGASVEGTIVDSSDAAVPGATIELRDPATNQIRTATSDAQGRFSFPDLPPSTYDVHVELAGFQPYSRAGLVVSIGTTVRLRVLLGPAALTESITVAAEPAPLDASQTSVVSVVDAERIEELPVRSRNYLEFALLAPGVVRVSSAPSSSAGASSVNTEGFSFGGLRPTSNALTIDGLDNNDAYTGGSRTELSLELVREFQVVTQGWSAEHGGAGGAINVVTKSGANTVHGDMFLFAQNGALNAPPRFEEADGRKPSLERYRAGVAAGGPIVKDRAFYYAAGEQEETRGQAASDIDPVSTGTINAALAARSTLRVTRGLFPTSLSETEVSGELTTQLSARDTIRARLSGTRNRNTADAFNTGGLVDASARGSRLTEDFSGTSSWTATPGSKIANELRGQVASRSLSQHSSSEGTPGFVISGVAEFGTPAVPLGSVSEHYLEVSDTLSVSRGRHLVRAGAEVRRVAVTSSMAEQVAPVSVYPSIAAFVANSPDQVRQSYGQGTRALDLVHAAGFAQDHWSATSSLTVDYGIRYDTNSLPSTLGVAQRLAQPRGGIAWTPGPAWVVRAGAGRFMDRLPLAAFDRVLARNGSAGWEEIRDSSSLASGVRSIYTARRGDWASASMQASAGVERQLSANVTATATYLYVRGTSLLRTINTNLQGDPARVDPRYADVFELQPTAVSSYHGIAFRLNRRLSDEFEWAAAYTLSKAIDDASAFDEQPEQPAAPSLDRGQSRYDRRHRLVASALFDLPIGDDDDRDAQGGRPDTLVRLFRNIEVAPILTIESGQPENAITGIDTFRTHAWPLSARPVGWRRNALRLPSAATLDLRVLKFFPLTSHGKLDLVVEAFNLLNRTNVSALNPVFGTGALPSSSFARPVDAASPRQIQFSVDFEF